ncbi:unnamed protein product [Medioppia subpectinata]|uniref:Uncharacterized protein n=1 Tax=Medioppia subpectinata TaxID=1979941 RepID=A0A7R9LN76_9ACAR|nr:unnamed protein product [Medioppia subpectinata]CAG2120245.1 unnamed protein product [Medioppia subpectinata]
MWCLNRNRSVKFKLIKTVVIVLFVLSGTQFFNISLTFTRGVWRALLGEDRIPEPVPKKKSFFGIDVINFDKTGPEGEIPNYIIRGAMAGILAIALAVIGLTGICNDSFYLVSAFTITMTTIVVLSGTLVMIYGSRYDANLPIIVCASICIVMIVFAVVIRRAKLLSY